VSTGFRAIYPKTASTAKVIDISLDFVAQIW